MDGISDMATDHSFAELPQQRIWAKLRLVTMAAGFTTAASWQRPHGGKEADTR
jgi:hypothetical protein